MRFEPRRPAAHEASILPLINVVFLLLIFFMLAGSLSVKEPLPVAAPESVSEGIPEQEALRLLLDRDGRMALDGEVIRETERLDRVREAMNAAPGRRLHLKADAAIAANQVAMLLEALRELGVERVRLITVQKAR